MLVLLSQSGCAEKPAVQTNDDTSAVDTAQLMDTQLDVSECAFPYPATFTPSDGAPVDWTDSFNGAVEITESGTLHLCEGTWSVNLDILANEVSIIGAGTDLTVLNAEDWYTVVDAGGASDLLITELTLSGGNGYYCSPYMCGGGLYLNYSDVTLESVTLSNNAAARGGAIYLENSSLYLSNSTITGNDADTYGGGIYVTETSQLTVSSSTLEDNSAPIRGGSLYIEEGSTASLVDTTIADNRAGASGGGIYIARSDLDVSSTDFIDNVDHDLYHSDRNDSYDLGLDAYIICTSLLCK